MDSRITFASVLTILLLSSFAILQSSDAKNTILENNSLYAIPNENATIILLKGTSYDDTTRYYPAHNTSDGYVPSSWGFALLSMGNGTTGLTISAHDCNVTITSFNYYLENTEGYNFKVNTWLNYTITGTGTQRLDYPDLYQNNRNPTVYLDGIVRQQGDGWNWANFGISISGASSEVSIHQEYNTYMPPRNAPQGSPLRIIVIFIIVVIVVVIISAIWVLYGKHRRTLSVNKGYIPRT